MKIYDRVDQLVGNTPLFNAKKIQSKLGLKSTILLKLECFNPAGSTKDRASLYMLNMAEEQGLIKAGATIIEPTSGNTGIGLASIGASRGYSVVLTMPDTMSKERILLLKAYGAKVVLTDGKLGMQGAIEKAIEINKNTPNSFIPSQFENSANPLAHYMTTAREIYNDVDGKIDYFVAGIGSGGSISGNGKYLKEKIKGVKVIGVEPATSPLISKGQSGSHKIQGIGANFIPKNFDNTIVDKVEVATDEQAYYYTNLLAKTEGILCGISSGAVLAECIKLAMAEDGKVIVGLLADTGERYLSTPNLFE